MLRRLTYSLLFSFLAFQPITYAVDVAQEPIFMSQQSNSNIMFLLDDSGSMDWEIMTRPHWLTSVYDRDYDRAWARGMSLGSLWGKDGNKETPWLVNDGNYYSYSGFCQDKSADGLCGNWHDLDGLATDYGSWVTQMYFHSVDHGGKNCQEITTTAHTNHEQYMYRHFYGHCATRTTSVSKANIKTIFNLKKNDNQIALLDVSPQFNPVNEKKGISFFHKAGNTAINVLGWLSGSDDLVAGSTCDVITKTITDTYTGNYNYGDTRYDVGSTTADETVCNADPTTIWVWDSGKDGKWAVDPALEVQTTIPQKVEVVPAVPALDIDGNGIIDLGWPHLYNKKDVRNSNTKVFHYLYPLSDRVYSEPTGVPFEGCRFSMDSSSVFACHHLQYPNYPADYPYSAALGQAATSPDLPGNEHILSLPNKVVTQERNASNSVYPWGRPPFANPFDQIQWTQGPWSDRLTAAGSHHAVSQYDPWPIISDWRIRSADFNVLYYSPNTDYKPWIGYTDASFTAARSNPESTLPGYSVTKDLGRPINGTDVGFVYAKWINDAGFFGGSPRWAGWSYDDCSKNYRQRTNVYFDWADGYAPFSRRNGFPWYRPWGTTVPDYVHQTTPRGFETVRDPATGIAIKATDSLCSPFVDRPNGFVDLWDSRYRATVKNNTILVQKVRRTPHMFGEYTYPYPYDSWKSYNVQAGDNNVPGNVAISATPNKRLISDTRYSTVATYTAGTVYPVDGLCEKVLGVDPVDPTKCRTVTQVKQNIANWFQYHRKRSFVAKDAISRIVKELPNLRYGLSTTSEVAAQKPTLFKGIPTGLGPYTASNNALISSLFKYPWKPEGTPLRKSLQTLGEYFKGNLPAPNNASPIEQSCQKNFVLMVTDGAWSGGSPAGIGDKDKDGYFNSANQPTLADVALKYYKEDLSTLKNDVPTTLFDQNNKQHLSLIGVGFGVHGNLKDKNSNGWPGNIPGSSLVESDDWGNPLKGEAEKVDDLWHATYNSKGLFVNAQDPDKLYAAIRDAVLLSSSKEGSASALSSNLNVISSATRVYQTRFKTVDWIGDLSAFTVDNNGKTSANALWRAQSLLDASSVTFDNRKIITSNALGQGIPFRWNSLDPSQQNSLSLKWPSTLPDPIASNALSFGMAQLDYLRGKKDSQFRDRASRLGDIVHSSPVQVGAPKQVYPVTFGTTGHRYKDFLIANSNRKSMVYVGANDGMLHAFDGTTGEENFAYIPRIVLPRLNSLSHISTADSPFLHRYFVDQTPTVKDAFMATANKWSTVLVGGLNGGGKGVYALDITKVPTLADNETLISAQIPLWEFGLANDGDMGLSFSQPVIAKLNNGQWAAIFGNGYNSANGRAVLYIVNLETGALIKRLDTGVMGQNGLSSASVVDINNDSIADYVYAGDLNGNLWKFDLRANMSSGWKVGLGGQPLFKAVDSQGTPQAIIQKPIVVRHPLGVKAGILIYMGTGRYLGFSDNVPVTSQDSLYAIWDDMYGVNTILRSQLLHQSVLSQQTVAGATARVTSQLPITWLNTGVSITSSGWSSSIVHHGWLLDLPDQGERSVSTPIVRGDSVLFSTLVPPVNSCDGGITGWLMSLNARTGARFDSPRIDVNNDGFFNASDTMNWTDTNGTGQTSAVSGIKSEIGVPSAPIVLSKGSGTGSTGRILTNSSSAQINGINLNDGAAFGRSSWIQLR